MFRNYIMSTPMTSEGANEYFADRIYGDLYNGDSSFIAILRALLDKRMPEGEKIKVMVGTNVYGTDFFASNPAARKREFFDNIHGARRIDQTGVFYLHLMNSRHDNNEATMKFVEENFLDAYPGWHRHENVTSLFAGSNFKVICYINPDLKSTAVYASDVTIRKYHLLQCAILGMVPWYFDPAGNVSDLEKKLMYSVLTDTEETFSQYTACLEEISRGYDFESVRLNRLLKGFEHKFEEIEISKARNSVANAERNIESLNRQMQEAISSLRDYNLRILSLEMRMNEEQDDGITILDYFKSHKNMYLERVNDTRLFFSVRGYLCYFDEGLYKRMIVKDSCYAYQYLDGEITKERIRRLLDAIFVDQTIKMKVCASYCLNVSSGVSGISGHSFQSMFDNWYPNPHIQYHSCLGNYITVMNKCIKDGNYLSAMEQCVASCVNLNFGDPTVTNEFFKDMCRNKSGLYYELPDGSSVNIIKAIEWLENQEKEDGHSEEEE